MKEIKQEKKKRRVKKRLRRIFVVLCLLCLGFVLLKCSKKEPDFEKTPVQVSEYEEQVNKITEIDYSKQQEALNAIVEEGKMNVNYSFEAIFKGTISEKFNIKNIKNNHHPIVFELYDEHDNCIYVSKQIEPGYEMSSIELHTKLSKGTHTCKLKVGYAKEGNVFSVFPITIEVK